LIEVCCAGENATNNSLSQHDTESSVTGVNVKNTSVTTCYHEHDVRISTAASKSGLRQSSTHSMPPVYGKWRDHALKTVHNTSHVYTTWKLKNYWPS